MSFSRVGERRDGVGKEDKKSDRVERTRREGSPRCYCSTIIREAVEQSTDLIEFAQRSLRGLSRVGSVARSGPSCRSAVKWGQIAAIRRVEWWQLSTWSSMKVLAAGAGACPIRGVR